MTDLSIHRRRFIIAYGALKLTTGAVEKDGLLGIDHPDVTLHPLLEKFVFHIIFFSVFFAFGSNGGSMVVRWGMTVFLGASHAGLIGMIFFRGTPPST